MNKREMVLWWVVAAMSAMALSNHRAINRNCNRMNDNFKLMDEFFEETAGAIHDITKRIKHVNVSNQANRILERPVVQSAIIEMMKENGSIPKDSTVTEIKFEPEIKMKGEK